ncbi:unnamed protein product [Rotaria sp. Silwood1]|nr:unnamed protein product [Rotaria sp. Silwood1]
MECTYIQLDELPDKILMNIFNKLRNVEILYSLLDVNKRLHKIVNDSIFTSCLTLFERSTDDLYYSLNNSILDRFCLKILPQIHDKIKCINIESSSMERILLSSSYPNLKELGLYDLEIKNAKHLFIENTSLINIFKNQISSLVIHITKSSEKYNTRNDILESIFTHIFCMFTNLQYLNFNPSLNLHQTISMEISRLSFFSSTLLELHINVGCFLDCLYLLDGHFNQLHTFHVNIYDIVLSNRLSMYNKNELPNLKCFSLHCSKETYVYDETIISLLHRMSNLETLDLHLIVGRKIRFIDGNDLKKNIINHMIKLKKFTFNICSNIICLHNQIDLISNEYIENTFRDFKNYQIISSIDYFSKAEKGQCLIYTYPYNLKYYNNITNLFQDGLFKYVSEISLYDEHPFEHEFFLRITQSFPFMKKLSLINEKPQMNKNQNLSIIEYPHLIKLVLIEAHEDYIEQFLLDTKSSLSHNVQLFAEYWSLLKVTHNFRRDTTRINCSKVVFCT